MKYWLFLLAAIFAEVAGTMFLKLSEGFTKPLPSLGVAVFYGMAFYFLSLTLRAIPVSVAYAVWAGVGIALVVVAGWVFFGQRLGLPALAGIALIIAGVVVLNIFSRPAH